MPHIWSSVAILATILWKIPLASGTPILSFPANAQLPPVAYVSQFFQFTFSRDTFQSTTGANLEYTISNGPDWLSLDSDSRTLTGIPATEDIGAATFDLIAKADGAEVTDNVTLVILGDQALAAAENILFELEKAGSTSAPATLLLKSQEAFSFSLSRTLFDGESSDTRFYAVSSNSSPLPAWLQFDPSSISFRGIAPSFPAVTSFKQSYSLSMPLALVASNVVGFSEAKIQFQIVIQSHLLAFQPSRLSMNATSDGTLLIPSLLSLLKLDDNAVRRGYLTSVASNAPEWLLLDDRDLSLHGKVPDTTRTFQFDVSVRGSDGEEANVTVLVSLPGKQVVDGIDLGIWNATRGNSFTHRIPRPSYLGRDVLSKPDLGSLTSWLKFDGTNLVLQGKVPGSQPLGRYRISIGFYSNAGATSRNLIINIVEGEPFASITRTGFPTRSDISPTSNSSPGCGTSMGSSKAKVSLGLKIALPILLVTLLVGMSVCFIRYRSVKGRGTGGTNAKEADSEHRMAGERCDHEAHQGVDPILESSPMPDVVPHARLSLAPDLMASQPFHDLEGNSTNGTKPTGLNWDDLITPSLVGSEDDIATGLPVIQLQRQRGLTLSTRREQSDVFTNKWKDLPSQDPSRSLTSPSVPSFSTISLPKRISGAGHGTGTSAILGRPDPRSSWYTTYGSLPTIDARHDNAFRSPFPVPPSYKKKLFTPMSSSKGKGRSRLSPTLVHKSSIKPGAFEEARQRYYTDRARDRLEGTSRFSNSSLRGMSRVGLASNHNKFKVKLRKSGMSHTTGSTPSWHRLSIDSTSVVYHHNHQKALEREISMASSGQFDSAVSSDSQWESEVTGIDRRLDSESNSQPQPEILPQPHSDGDKIETNRKDEMFQQPTQPTSSTQSTSQRGSVLYDATPLYRSEESLPGSFRFV